MPVSERIRLEQELAEQGEVISGRIQAIEGEIGASKVKGLLRKARISRKWFVGGAVVVGTGLILGMILRSSSKPRSEDGLSAALARDLDDGRTPEEAAARAMGSIERHQGIFAKALGQLLRVAATEIGKRGVEYLAKSFESKDDHRS